MNEEYISPLVSSSAGFFNRIAILDDLAVFSDC